MAPPLFGFITSPTELQGEGGGVGGFVEFIGQFITAEPPPLGRPPSLAPPPSGYFGGASGVKVAHAALRIAKVVAGAVSNLLRKIYCFVNPGGCSGGITPKTPGTVPFQGGQVSGASYTVWMRREVYLVIGYTNGIPRYDPSPYFSLSPFRQAAVTGKIKDIIFMPGLPQESHFKLDLKNWNGETTQYINIIYESGNTGNDRTSIYLKSGARNLWTIDHISRLDGTTLANDRIQGGDPPPYGGSPGTASKSSNVTHGSPPPLGRPKHFVKTKGQAKYKKRGAIAPPAIAPPPTKKPKTSPPPKPKPEPRPKPKPKPDNKPKTSPPPKTKPEPKPNPKEKPGEITAPPGRPIYYPPGPPVPFKRPLKPAKTPSPNKPKPSPSPKRPRPSPSPKRPRPSPFPVIDPIPVRRVPSTSPSPSPNKPPPAPHRIPTLPTPDTTQPSPSTDPILVPEITKPSPGEIEPHPGTHLPDPSPTITIPPIIPPIKPDSTPDPDRPKPGKDSPNPPPIKPDSTPDLSPKIKPVLDPDPKRPPDERPSVTPKKPSHPVNPRPPTTPTHKPKTTPQPDKSPYHPDTTPSPRPTPTRDPVPTVQPDPFPRPPSYPDPDPTPGPDPTTTPDPTPDPDPTTTPDPNDDPIPHIRPDRFPHPPPIMIPASKPTRIPHPRWTEPIQPKIVRNKLVQPRKPKPRIVYIHYPPPPPIVIYIPVPPMPCDPCSAALQLQLNAILKRLNSPIFGAISSMGCSPSELTAFPYQGLGIDGISAQLNAMSSQIDLIRKQLCNYDQPSAFPAHWNVPAGSGIPQLCLFLAPRNPDGSLGRADTTLNIPNWSLGRAETQNGFNLSFSKGQFLGRIVFSDNTRIIAYFASKQMAQSTLAYIANFLGIETAQQYYSEVPTTKNIGAKDVYLKYAKFYSAGRERVSPDWQVAYV